MYHLILIGVHPTTYKAISRISFRIYITSCNQGCWAEKIEGGPKNRFDRTGWLSLWGSLQYFASCPLNLWEGPLNIKILRLFTRFFKKTVMLPESQISYLFQKLSLRFSYIFLNFYWNKLATMVYPFVITIVYLNFNSIFNILNAITTKCRFLANKNSNFWKLNLVIFLRFAKENFDHLSLMSYKLFSCKKNVNFKDMHVRVFHRPLTLVFQNYLDRKNGSSAPEAPSSTPLLITKNRSQ